ncbi:MAG: hypothetical protein K6253_01070 [Candidatus Liberibacter asiaticus]|nr:hypothetical protein [Candidatus Liberibacter asiaticus]
MLPAIFLNNQSLLDTCYTFCLLIAINTCILVEEGGEFFYSFRILFLFLFLFFCFKVLLILRGT